MPRKVVPPPHYPYPPWEAPIDLDPHLLRQAAACAAMPRQEFISWLLDKTPSEVIVAMRLRFRYDRMWFLTHHWPDVFALPFNQYHQHALTEPKVYFRHRKGIKRRSTAAPRGIAKTTTSKGDLLHDIVYGLEGLVVVHSAGMSNGSEPFVRDVANLAMASPALTKTYGQVQVWPDGDFTVTQVGNAPPTPLLARSFKTQVRGTNWRAQRPTKYLIDDGEHPERVRSPVNRAVDAKYMAEDIDKCGPKEGGLVIDMRGTVLHPDSLLVGTMTNPAWRFTMWQSIIGNQWPTNESLWKQCKDIWCDLTREDREEASEAFYNDNKEAMDEGCTVLDPVAEPLYALMVQVWGMGLASFMKEKQNVVSSSMSAFFDMDNASWFEVETHPKTGRLFIRTGAKLDTIVWVDELQKVMYLDPIPGSDLGRIKEEGSGASDYAAIAILGRDKFGYCYVLDVWLRRATDAEQLRTMFEKAQQWGVRKAFIESVGFSRLVTRDFNRLRHERRQRGEFYDVQVEEDTAATNIPKVDRIAKLQTPVNDQRWLRFNVALGPDVTKQFAEFPDGHYDDAPDAVAGAYNAMGGSAPEVRTGPVRTGGVAAHPRAGLLGR